MDTIILLFLLALPIAGVVAYIRLIRKMRREQITAIPKFSLFMLFLICGTLLMEILLGISGFPIIAKYPNTTALFCMQH